MIRRTTLFLFLFLALLPWKEARCQVPARDSLALVSLYSKTNGPGWTNKANWLTGYVQNWYGITVTAGRVTDISLGGNNLTGQLPYKIGGLDALASISLGSNNLSGELPDSLYLLTNLVSLT